MSCPRSSVQNGWVHDGPSSLDAKSISLIGTRQSSGPSTTASTMIASTTELAIASLCRRKRRHASRPGVDGALLADLAPVAAAAAPGASAVRDAGVEPAIKDICNEV